MKKLLAIISLFIIPIVSYGASGTLGDIITSMTKIIKTLIPLLFALALVVFLFGGVKFIMHAGDEGKREEGKKLLLWGIIGLFVMVSIWGLVTLLGDTFQLNNVRSMPVPHF